MATQKKTSPQNTRHNRTKPSNLKKHITVFVGVCLMVFLVALGYSLGKNDSVLSTAGGSVKQVTASAPQLTVTQKAEANLSKPIPLKPEIPKERAVTTQTENNASAKISSVDTQNKVVSAKATNANPAQLAYRGTKPKLVIIIDDVTSPKQLAAIRALPIKVTPSLFPPYALSKSNHTLAKGLQHYMIHFPMESGKVYDKQLGTLRVSDSEETMRARVKELRKLFPTARYVNNHTGSVFTKNEPAMKRLYEALRNEGFVFVDSRTVAKTTVQKIAHDFGDVYVARDVFLDNKKSIPAIHAQLKQAVKEAKKNGYAIAIGHPYEITMRALSKTKGVLDEVEVVYIDAIYRKHN